MMVLCTTWKVKFDGLTLWCLITLKKIVGVQLLGNHQEFTAALKHDEAQFAAIIKGRGSNWTATSGKWKRAAKLKNR